MAADARKRQKKLERRAAQRKSKQRQLNRQKNAGLADRLSQAADYPVDRCGLTTDLWTKGLGWVYLSRALPGGMVAFSVFLVDRYCLGVKNAMADIRSASHFAHEVMGKLRSGRIETIEPAAARKLVEGSVAYAHGLGLSPHPDFHKARKIFGDIDPAACPDEFEFGLDGKPHFMAGPYDTPDRCRMIMKTLAFHLGPDAFHFTIPLGRSGGLVSEGFEDALLEMDEDLDDEDEFPEG